MKIVCWRHKKSNRKWFFLCRVTSIYSTLKKKVNDEGAKILAKFFIIDNTAEKGIRKRENVNRESHYYTFSLFSFAFAEWIYSHAITSIFSHTATNFISFSFFPFLPSNAYLSISFVLFPFLLCWTNLLSRFRNVGKDVWNNYLITCFWLWGELDRYCCWTHILWQRSLQLPYLRINRLTNNLFFHEFQCLAVAGN